MPPWSTSFPDRSMDKPSKTVMPERPVSAVDENSRLHGRERPGYRFYFGWVIAILIVMAVLGAFVLARNVRLRRQSRELQQAQQQGPRVLVKSIMHPPSNRTMELPASLRGYTETPIYAKIAGYLRTIKVDKGDRVKKGQVLAVLDSPELDHQVANARAAYDLDVITDQRNQALAREGVFPQQTADDSHNTMLAAKATLQQYRAMEEYKIITAPFSGVVTARYFDPGALIPQTTASSGNTPILTVATLAPVRVYSDVPQDLAPFIRDGDPAEITVGEYPGRIFRGKVTRHPEALTPATRTMLVEVDLPNRDQALFPGMYAKVVFHVVAPVKATMVPDDALVFRDGKPYVPVVRENILKLIPVKLGFDDGVNVEVTGEISDQDTVALNVGQAAHDGERVQPITAQQQQSTAAQ
jgi:RND family efflux transporter MFP subunit